MSRIGRLPITVPAGVTVTVDSDNLVTVKGPKGTLSQQVNSAITVKQEGNVLTLERPTDSKPHKAMHGLYRALVHNMVVGVTDGFSKTLELVGTGYRAAAEGGKKLRTDGIRQRIHVAVDGHIGSRAGHQLVLNARIEVGHFHKQVVGNLAADIRAIRKPEPYLGKGIKYADEHIRRKEGKTGKK